MSRFNLTSRPITTPQCDHTPPWGLIRGLPITRNWLLEMKHMKTAERTCIWSVRPAGEWEQSGCIDVCVCCSDSFTLYYLSSRWPVRVSPSSFITFPTFRILSIRLLVFMRAICVEFVYDYSIFQCMILDVLVGRKMRQSQCKLIKCVCALLSAHSQSSRVRVVRERRDQSPGIAFCHIVLLILLLGVTEVTNFQILHIQWAFELY